MKKLLLLLTILFFTTTANAQTRLDGFTNITDLGDADEFILWDDSAAAVRNIDWEDLKGEIYEGINWSATPIIPNTAINWTDIDEDVIVGVNWDDLGGGDSLWSAGIDSKIWTDVNVGLGTNDPTQQLELTGAIKLPVTTASDVGVLYYGSDRWLHGFQATDTNGQNVFIGRQAGNFSMVYNDSNEDASANTGVGDRVLDALTYGKGNTCFGRLACSAITTGSQNSGTGNQTFLFLTTGSNNSAYGNYALENIRTQSGNSAFGYAALKDASTTAGDYNVAMGYFAGRYQANGSTGLNPANSIYIGANSKGLNNSDDNAIVIGYNAVGVGANKAVIGNTDITDTHVRGVRNTGTMTIIGATNNCILTVDADGTCDAGTKLGEDNSIAICAVCAAN